MCEKCEIIKKDSFDIVEVNIGYKKAFDFGPLGSVDLNIFFRHRDDEEDMFNHELLFETMVNVGVEDSEFLLDTIHIPINTCPFCGRELDNRDVVAPSLLLEGGGYDFGHFGSIATSARVIKHDKSDQYDLILTAALSTTDGQHIPIYSGLSVSVPYSPFLTKV